jgi:hypothetical protein
MKGWLTLMLWVSPALVAAEDGGPRREGQATIPSAASPGPRDPAKLKQVFSRFIEEQPFGKSWKDLAHTAPAPKDRTGLGEAKTHPGLKHDPIEMQAQAQFLEETEVSAAFGLVSVRAVRAYRYGKLAAIQLVLDRTGDAQPAPLGEDLRALAEAWKQPLGALGLSKGYQVKRDDLADYAAGRKRSLPLRIVVEPAP